MISLSELKTAFKDYRYYYGVAPVGTQTPYLVARGVETDNFAADNSVYQIKPNISLDCYFTSKDETTEAAIEAILDALGVFWNKTETFDDDETFYLINYSFWR